MELETNVIYCGDCRQILRNNIPDNSIDLIYLDPPFFSNKNYEIIWGNGAERRSFEDRWKGGIEHYVSWMEERLEACRAVLKDAGSIYVHCDWRASHHLRVSLDRIFDYGNFKNEIIWHFGLGGGPRNHWNRKHNNIYFYTKSEKFTFNMQYVSATSQRMKGMEKKMDDVWDIPSINNMSHERLGYPTQKPEALLERIIISSSNPGDSVLDPFCGGGTTIAAAHNLSRRWIGIDVSPVACRVMQKRMKDIGIESRIIGGVISIEELKSYSDSEFQEWACARLGGKSKKKKRGDMGVDGYTLRGIPISVKKSSGVGRNVVDNFETAIRRENKAGGIIVAYTFTSGAYEEVARIRKELDIKLVQVEKITDSMINGDNL